MENKKAGAAVGLVKLNDDMVSSISGGLLIEPIIFGVLGTLVGTGVGVCIYGISKAQKLFKECKETNK